MPDAPRLERLDRSDWRLLAVCAIVLAGSLAFGLRYFDRAFPEASIDFRYDRAGSREIALEFLAAHGLDPDGRRHAARFDVDDAAKIYLERSIGLAGATGLMGDEVEVWAWTHRWFRPLDAEELVVAVSPRGEIVAFEHKVPEDRAAATIAPEARASVASDFLRSIGVDVSQLDLVSTSERTLPARVDAVLVWEHRTVRPASAPYRYEVTLHGDTVGGFRQSLEVPETWKREYASLRAKNEAANDVASGLLAITTIAALFVFVIRVRRHDVQIRYSLWVGGVCAGLLILVSLNALPSALAGYDSRTSFSSFLFAEIGLAVLGGVSLGLFLMVMVGAGDALLRERLPRTLAMPLLFSRKAFRSKRVLLGNVIGFTLVGAFLAWQVGFYLVAERFGAWAPAEIPYDDALNTLFPWAVVLFAGFFPAFSEEYISRAFSIPFLEKLLRHRFAAIAISAFVWGFAHSSYANQPFYMRGLEVGVAGVVIGYVVYRFGILPALVWHYTVDAIYTSLLLVQSGNAYYAASASICALVFLVPIAASVVQYLRHGGFEPDDALENGAIGTAAAVEPPRAPDVPLPPRIATPRGVIVAGIVAAAAGLTLMLQLPPKLAPLGTYPMSPDDAIAIAVEHFGLDERSRPEKTVVFPSAGFRNWIDGPNGGAQGSYDIVAAESIAKDAGEPFETLRGIMANDVQGATWKVRMFTPGVTEELAVEIDPRTRRVVGEQRRVEEKARGATLEQEEAAAIATAALERFRLEPRDFELREAVAVPMPDRRDWVFQFERREPLADDAWMRVAARIAGDEVTEVARTVRIPEETRREAEESTLVHSLLFFARLGGAIFLLVVAGSGAVMAFRDSGLVWKPALRATALLAVPAALAAALPFGLAARNYPTSVDWNTFLGRQALFTLESVAFGLFIIFLSLVAISVCAPWVTGAGSLDARARVGRDAVIRGAAAAAIVWALLLAGDALELATRVGLDLAAPVSESVAIPVPALAALWQSISIAAWVAALAVASSVFLAKLESATAKRWNELAIVISSGIVLADSAAPMPDLPVALVQGLVAGLVLWLVAKHLFAANPLAVPVALLLVTLTDDVALWLASGRPDLQANAMALVVVVVALVGWLAARGGEIVAAE